MAYKISNFRLAELMLSVSEKLRNSNSFVLEYEEKLYWKIDEVSAFDFLDKYEIECESLSDFSDYFINSFDKSDLEMRNIDLYYMSELLKYIFFRLSKDDNIG